MIEKYFFDNYSVYLKHTNKPQIPHFNTNKLLEYVEDKHINSAVFIQEIKELNNCIKQNWKTLPIDNINKKIQLCNDKQNDDPIYIGKMPI